LKNSARRYVIFSDFDGTITTADTLVYLLDNYGDPHWWDIEKSLLRGEMDEKEALRREIDTLCVTWDTALEALYNNIKLEAGFADFLKWIQDNKLPFIILSGGFAEISRALLGKYDLDHIEIRANSLEISGDRWRVIPAGRPKIKGRCDHCKSFSVKEMREDGYTTIYIGDGSNDRCPATYANIVFAKNDLEEFCKQNDVAYYHYADFNDILKIIQSTIIAK